MKKILTLLLLLTHSMAALSQEQKVFLYSATSDGYAGKVDVNLYVDDVLMIQKFSYLKDGKEEFFFPEQLKKGVVLMKHNGVDVCILSSDNFDPAYGGDFNLHYLHNGLTGVYKDFPSTLDRQGQNWVISTDLVSGRLFFTSMFLKIKRFLGSPIGIEKILVQ